MRTLHACSILSLLMVALLAVPAAADDAGEADLETLVDTIAVNKRALLEVNLQLDDAAAAAFWPVYDRYAAELVGVNNRFAAIVDEYTKSFATMTHEQGKRLAGDYLAVERERAELREKYFKPFSEALPGRTLVRFYQIENKMQAVVRFALARTIPVIDQ